MTTRTRLATSLATAVAVASISIWATSAWRVGALPGPTESTIVNVAPERVMDTRDPVNLGLNGPFVSPVSQKLQITGSITTATGTKTVVPAGATGVLLNVTGFNPSANGFISIRPGDATGAPTTSSLNVLAGQTVPNSVQVALPTSGANTGQIDITFDALGVTGPTTELLIDVVGYTTNTGLQDVNTQLGQKANSADVHTKTEADARYLPHGEIVLSYAPIFTPSTLVPATIFLFANAGAQFNSNGIGYLSLTGPDKLGAVAYGLKSVTYCVFNISGAAKVSTVTVEHYGPTETDWSTTTDPTDRTAPGCYTVAVNNATATTHMLGITVFDAGAVSIRSVSAVWAPASTLS